MTICRNSQALAGCWIFVVLTIIHLGYHDFFFFFYNLTAEIQNRIWHCCYNRVQWESNTSKQFTLLYWLERENKGKSYDTNCCIARSDFPELLTITPTSGSNISFLLLCVVVYLFRDCYNISPAPFALHISADLKLECCVCRCHWMHACPSTNFIDHNSSLLPSKQQLVPVVHSYL